MVLWSNKPLELQTLNLVYIHNLSLGVDVLGSIWPHLFLLVCKAKIMPKMVLRKNTWTLDMTLEATWLGSTRQHNFIWVDQAKNSSGSYMYLYVYSAKSLQQIKLALHTYIEDRFQSKMFLFHLATPFLVGVRLKMLKMALLRNAWT